MIKEIREELDQLGEESYKQFNQKLYFHVEVSRVTWYSKRDKK